VKAGNADDMPYVSPEDADKTELFVRQISENTWESSIRELFEKYGELVKCKHLFDKQCAFVEFKEHKDAAKATAVNGTELDGAVLDVAFSKELPKAPAGESNTVFCGNMSFYTTEDTLREFFSSVGNVGAIRIATDQETGRPKGFCHVEFDDNS